MDLLKGKKIIITGGSFGIGKALAIAFAESGAEIGLLSRTKEKLEENIEMIIDRGGIAYYETADITDYSQVKSAINSLITKLGGIDILINNAGVARIKDFNLFKPHQIDMVIDANVKGVMFSTLAAIPYLLEQKESGFIINTSSIAGIYHNLPTHTVYSSSKAAVNMFTQSLAFELSPKNIWVNAVLPGNTDTRMIHFGITEEEVKARNPCEPEDLIPFYTFYASEKTKKIAGRLCNIEDFRALHRISKEIPSDLPKNWESLNPLIKEKLPINYEGLKSNKELVDWLFSVNYPFSNRF